MYLGASGMKAQMKYADKRRATVAVIEGGDERDKGEVTLKDLELGAQKATEISDNVEWRSGDAAQISVPRAKLVDGVRQILTRYDGE
jgi:histidyl-tRNA synthetase